MYHIITSHESRRHEYHDHEYHVTSITITGRGSGQVNTYHAHQLRKHGHGVTMNDHTTSRSRTIRTTCHTSHAARVTPITRDLPVEPVQRRFCLIVGCFRSAVCRQVEVRMR